MESMDIESESQIQPAYQSNFAKELSRSMQQAEMSMSQPDIFVSQNDANDRSEIAINLKSTETTADIPNEITPKTTPNNSQYTTPCSSVNQFLVNLNGNSQYSLNNSEGLTQTLSSTQASSTQAFLAQPMSPILSKKLTTPKIQQSLDNMFLNGTGRSRKHSEAFKSRPSNKRNTASVAHTNIFQHAANEISDDSDSDDTDDDTVFIESTQQDKEKRTIVKAKRAKDRYTADMEKKQRKADNRRTKDLNKQIEDNVDNDAPISNADLKWFMFNMNKAVENLQAGQQESNKTISNTIERTVTQTVEQSIGKFDSRLKTLETDVKTLKIADTQNQIAREFVKNQPEINKGHSDAISSLTDTMLKQTQEIELMKKEMEEHKASGEEVKVTQFLKKSIEQRLKMNVPYMTRWAEALAIMTYPQNAPKSLNLGLELVDSMWHIGGDTNVDMSWYTKRLILLGIYKTTELAMMQDQSDGYRETWAFLDRRFDDSNSLQDLLGAPDDAVKILGAVGSTVKAFLGVKR